MRSWFITESLFIFLRSCYFLNSSNCFSAYIFSYFNPLNKLILFLNPLILYLSNFSENQPCLMKNYVNNRNYPLTILEFVAIFEKPIQMIPS